MTSKKDKKDKSAKSKQKVRLIRDSYTIPEAEFSSIAALKKKCLTNGVEVKKSELLRAGLLVLAEMDTEALTKTVARIERIKTGRPKKPD